MTGEELLEQVRWHSGNRGIGHFIEINRALREWSQMAGLPWLREVRGGALLFRSTEDTYPVASLGLRRIDRIYVQGTDTAWKEMEEYQPPGFEAYVRSRINEDSTVDTGRPRVYAIIGSQGQIAIKISPTPDKNYVGRVDGISETPIVVWDQQLPGPAEYHDHVALLAAGYHIQGDGRRMLKDAKTQEQIMAAQTIMGDGKAMEADALMKLRRVTEDAFANRLATLKPKKVKLAR